MPGSHGKLPAPELPAEERLALVVATATYTDQSLRQLRAPARDASELGDVLADPDIGGFTVTRVIDQPAQEVRLAVEEFLTDRRPQDLLVVYLSCHGLVDSRRRLYFAATDTRKNRLAATGVAAEWLLDQMEDCRARRQLVILDCCFSGAFAQGAKGDSNLGLGERFHGQGRGRVVLTASRGSEYSFEGEPLAGSAAPTGSVFTSALVAGMRTGAADADNDGFISVDDAYTYAFDSVRAANSNQTPQRWLYGAEGDILLARNPAGITVVPAALPEALRNSLDSGYPALRLGAVSALGELLQGADPARALAARIALQQVAENDIPRVASAARALVESPSLDTGPADASTPVAEVAGRDTPAAVDVPEARGPAGTSTATLAEPDSPELVPSTRWALTLPQGGDAPQDVGGKEAAERETGGIPDETNTAGTGWSGIRRAAAHILRARVVIVGLVVLLVAATATTAILLNKSPENSAPSSPDPVSTVAFSPDGKTLATASYVGTARMWDVATRKLIGQLGEGVYDLAFSPDGKTVATAHGDNTVRLWNLATRKQITDPLTGHTQADGGSAVRCVAFSPDGKTLASGGADGTVRLWDSATGEKKGDTLFGHTGEVHDIAFSPNGKIIGSAGGEYSADPIENTGEVRLWDASTGHLVHELKKRPDAPMALSVAFSPDSKVVAAGFLDDEAVLWSVATGRPVGDPLPGDGGVITGLVFSSDGKMIAGAHDGGVLRWNRATGQLLRDSAGENATSSQIYDVAFSPDGKMLASGDRDGTVRLWNSATGRLIDQLR